MWQIIGARQGQKNPQNFISFVRKISTWVIESIYFKPMCTKKQGLCFKPILFITDENDEYEPDDKTLLLFPQLVAHRIDEDSPFYSMGQKELLAAKFELLVTLEGVIESTGNSVQIRSSYLPNEILWGCRFENMVNYR